MKIVCLLAALLTLGACTTATPIVQRGPGAEVTFDGLHRVDNTRFDRVWIKPEIDLSRYDEIMVESAGIRYREADAQNRYDRSASSFPLDEKQKNRFKEIVREVMTEELTGVQNYTFTRDPGPGVLKLTVGLIDVISRVPPETVSARSRVYLNSLGSATFVLEISDSRTDEMLARTADNQIAEPNVVQNSNPVTNSAEVRRSVRVWGSRLRESLDELHELGCYACNVQDTSTN